MTERSEQDRQVSEALSIVMQTLDKALMGLLGPELMRYVGSKSTTYGDGSKEIGFTFSASPKCRQLLAEFAKRHGEENA